MNIKSDTTTVGVFASTHAAVATDPVAVAAPLEGDTMANERGHAAKKTAKATPAKATPAKTGGVAKATPAKTTPATKATKATPPAPPAEAPAGLFSLLANVPLAGEGIDPSAKGPRSFHITDRTLARARAAVHWLSAMGGVDAPDTVSELAERGLLHEVERLEATFNGGKPFPAVQGRMRPGPGASGSARVSDFQARRRRRGTETGGDGDG
jgi:hypothetical protein